MYDKLEKILSRKHRLSASKFIIFFDLAAVSFCFVLNYDLGLIFTTRIAIVMIYNVITDMVGNFFAVTSLLQQRRLASSDLIHALEVGDKIIDFTLLSRHDGILGLQLTYLDTDWINSFDLQLE